MSAFSAAWLGLREPLDAASRDAVLCAALAATTPDGLRNVTDLAAGTGANLRYLSPRLGGRQHWRLIDHDDALLAAVPERLAVWARALGATLEAHADGTLLVHGATFECRIERVHLDLVGGIESLDLPRASLVTASALLDLVSVQWLETLAERCRHARADALLALTYDGLIRFDPHDPDDTFVTELVNRHQRSDKGFGSALGPMAADCTTDVFARNGFVIERARSDWQIDDHRRAVHDALIADWATAAAAMAPDDAPRIEAWAARRAATRHARLVVGHVDLLARYPID